MRTVKFYETPSFFSLKLGERTYIDQMIDLGILGFTGNKMHGIRGISSRPKNIFDKNGSRVAITLKMKDLNILDHFDEAMIWEARLPKMRQSYHYVCRITAK